MVIATKGSNILCGKLDHHAAQRDEFDGTKGGTLVICPMTPQIRRTTDNSKHHTPIGQARQGHGLNATGHGWRTHQFIGVEQPLGKLQLLRCDSVLIFDNV